MRKLLEKIEKRTLTEDVGQEILRQLGGHRFVAMTGAKNFVTDKNSLSFRLPKAKDRINFVVITLTGRDDYDVTFSRYANYETTEISHLNGIYADQLVDVIEKKTGLAFHL